MVNTILLILATISFNSVVKDLGIFIDDIANFIITFLQF